MHLNLTSVYCWSCTISGPAPECDYGLLKMFFFSLLPQCFRFREKRNWLLQRRIQWWSQKRKCLWWWCWFTAERNRSAEQTWYQGKYVVFHMQKYGMQEERLDWVIQPELLSFSSLLCWNNTARMSLVEEQGRTRKENYSIWKTNCVFIHTSKWRSCPKEGIEDSGGEPLAQVLVCQERGWIS